LGVERVFNIETCLFRQPGCGQRAKNCLDLALSCCYRDSLSSAKVVRRRVRVEQLSLAKGVAETTAHLGSITSMLPDPWHYEQRFGFDVSFGNRV